MRRSALLRALARYPLGSVDLVHALARFGSFRTYRTADLSGDTSKRSHWWLVTDEWDAPRRVLGANPAADAVVSLRLRISTVLEEALASDGIAQRDGLLVV
jgi:hypothetical protein